jgi:Uma2 family endonuclease
MVQMGMFEGERVELLFGTIVLMSPHGPEHDGSLDDLGDRLTHALGTRAKVRIQSAFAASDGSEPEPDIAVVARQSYRAAHPDRAWLIVEVADSSLAKDRELKAKLYAASQVDEYWIVNLVDRAIEVYRDPRDGVYASVSAHARGDVLRLLAFDDVEVNVSDVIA